MSSSFSRAATMNRAKSTRRVMLLSRIGSPTCLLQTGRPWLSPSSRSLPRTTVQRVSLAKTRLHASTWSLRSAKRARRASGPPIFTSALSFHEYTSCPSRVMCQPHENTRRAPGGAWSSTAWAVPVDTARDEHDEHPVAPSDGAPDDVGVVRGSGDDRDTPLEFVELPDALLSAHADHLVPPIERVLHHVLPELPGSADDADPHRARPIACQRIAGSITGLRR